MQQKYLTLNIISIKEALGDLEIVVDFRLGRSMCTDLNKNEPIRIAIIGFTI